MSENTMPELTVGQYAEVRRHVSQSDVLAFVEVVGDENPIHRDAAFARRTPFGAPIAPGLFTAGLISAIIGTELPGPGTIYLSQSLRFLKPVRIGDTITARVEVVELLAGRNRVRLRTVCTNERGDEVLAGEAWVKAPESAPGARRAVGAGVVEQALAV